MTGLKLHSFMILVGMLTAFLLVYRPVYLAGGLVAVAIASLALHLRSVAVMLLCVLAGLVPLHGLLLEVGVPSWWKEAVAAFLLAVALPRLMDLQRHRLAGPVLGFLAVVLVSGIVNGRLGALDWRPYIAYLPLALAIPVCLSREKHLFWVATAGISGALIDAVIVIVSQIRGRNLVSLAAFQSDFLDVLRPGSYAGPNLLTATLLGIVAAGLLAWLLLARSTAPLPLQLVMLGLSAIFLAACFATLARGAVLAAAVGFFAAVYVGSLRKRERGRRHSALLPASFVLGVFLIALLVAPSESIVAQRFQSTEASQRSDTTRVGRWTAAIALGLESPVIGQGPGATGLSRVREVLGPDTTYVPDTVAVPISESNWLKIFAELGIVGVGAAIVLVNRAIRILWRAASSSLVARVVFVLLAVVVLHGAVYQSMESYVAGIAFWGLIGVAGFYDRKASLASMSGKGLIETRVPNTQEASV